MHSHNMKNLIQAMLLSAAMISNVVAEERPNIIIVMTDDQGYGDLSCHGNPILKTPELDKLHAESVRFTDFHVSPFCTPTRAALMTGNHPAVTGAYRTSSGRSLMHVEEKTIANLLADNGYATGMVGKWHLGDNAPHRPQDRGFQDVVWHRAGGIGQAPDYWGNDYFDDTYERNGKYEKFQGYCTDVFFTEGMRFIQENKEQPFFLYLALNAPHGPYNVDKKWAKPYEGNKDVVLPNFYGMIANIDWNMGRLRQFLKEEDIEDNTILIFLTDNGTAKGAAFKGLDSLAVKGYNAGLRGKKSSVYDGGQRVPFFIYWKDGGLTGGKDIHTLAAHIDILPTLADICGITVPEEYDVDGLSIKPLLDGKEDEWERDHLVLQYHGGPYGKALPAGPLKFSCVMTEKWRLVETEGLRLFNIQADPGQQEDVSKQHPEVVNQLKGYYGTFWQRVSKGIRPVRIDIGNPHATITDLSSQDWFMESGNPPWSARAVKALPKVTGPWMLNVVQSGTYRFTLRQLPKQAQKPLNAVKARITIAGKEKEVPVKEGEIGAVIELDIPAGETSLITYLYNEKGEAGGAYFTEVELIKTQ